MTTLTVGLIPSPDLPADIVEKITNVLVEDLKKDIDSDIHWKVETEVDPLTGAAEQVNEIADKAAIIKQQHNWNYAISLTDLPCFSNHKAVTADISIQRGAALVSLPSFGAFPLKKRVRKALIFIMNRLYTNNEDAQVQKKAPSLKSRFLLSRINKVQALEDPTTNTRFIIQSSVVGWLRILSGMTFANRPWKALGSFKTILTLSFATGTYISIFNTPWQLSVTYSPLRLLMLMVLSISGMVTWLIFAHNLWEKSSLKGQSQYRILYNVTTITTLTIVAMINYAALYLIILLSITLFVPPDLFETWADVNTDDIVLPFMRLAWLTTSLGLLAGAVGATAEKEEKIRNITYCYRQLNRKHQLNKRAEKESSTEPSQQGVEQRHRESETT